MSNDTRSRIMRLLTLRSLTLAEQVEVLQARDDDALLERLELREKIRTGETVTNTQKILDSMMRR